MSERRERRKRTPLSPEAQAARVPRSGAGRSDAVPIIRSPEELTDGLLDYCRRRILVLETLGDPTYLLCQLRDPGSGPLRHGYTEPRVGNGMVEFRRFRVTVEEVSEPTEVLAARLQQLWDLSDNVNDREPLMYAAAEIGYTLVGDRGRGRRTEGQP